MHDLMTDFETVTPDLWMANEEGWKEKLLKLPNWIQIPLINSNASHNLPDNTLVRFRGMIQDMHNPEFYFEQFEILNTATNEIKHKSGKYRDTAHVSENEKINYMQNLKSAQRQTMVVVSFPGYNDWAQSAEDKENHLEHLEEHPNSSKRLNQTTMKLKRSYNEADDDSDAMELENESLTNKEPRNSTGARDGGAPGLSREHLLNFPLPDTPGKACILKIYDESEDLKLNEMIEAVGFLSVDPALSGEFREPLDPLLHPQTESEAEIVAHNPPPSLIPRLHAVYVKRLQHCNPLVKTIDEGALLGGARAAREHLHRVLTAALLGDALAADFLLCQLVSSVFSRPEAGCALGQLCVNVSAVPGPVPARLYSVLRRLVPASHCLRLTTDALDTLTLTPRKDYECDRLTSGALQLCRHTLLVVDETGLAEGRLGAAGLNNLAALGRLVQDQVVQYDFTHYQMDFPCDVSVLLLSDGKSLLPSHFHVPLRPEPGALQQYEAALEAAAHSLTGPALLLLRTYLTGLKLTALSLGDDLQFIQDDFVEMRRKSDAEDPVTGEDLHNLLVLARLDSLSRGRRSLQRDSWERATSMDAQRRRRLRGGGD